MWNSCSCSVYEDVVLDSLESERFYFYFFYFFPCVWVYVYYCASWYCLGEVPTEAQDMPFNQRGSYIFDVL